MGPLGATARAGGRTEFRVWAPRARHGRVEWAGGDAVLEREGDGCLAAVVAAGHGDDYLLRVDGGPPHADPCSRHQPEGVTGPSRVVDPTCLPGPAATGAATAWCGLDPNRAVIHEVHVGTATPEGTFAGVAGLLPGLRDLGITAIELMPVATFPGARNWGYDGLYTWAPHPGYGGPEGLAHLVQAAHATGMGVILDVVYNHLGPGERSLLAFGPYLAASAPTPWGRRPDFRVTGVREWAIQNAEMWLRDYGIDGLRVDAVDAIVDEGPRHMLSELTDRARAAARHRPLLIAESAAGARATTPATAGGWGFDAHWDDRFHHHLHAALTGERDGYYAGCGSPQALADATVRPATERRVVYAHNHDQVGNRALGDRLPADARPLALMWTLLAPGIPMLFMGDEDDADSPFQFFTDHIDPLIADATRAGRRREFAHFAAFAGDLPDPQDPHTFTRSRPPGVRDETRRAYVRRLIRARATLGAPLGTRHDAAGWVVARRRSGEVCGNFSRRPVRLAVHGTRVALASDTAMVRLDAGTLHLGPRTGAVVV